MKIMAGTTRLRAISNSRRRTVPATREGVLPDGLSPDGLSDVGSGATMSFAKAAVLILRN
jgi:hypothetical protein